MTNDKLNHQALLITSFKGGAGKTTISLGTAITAALYKQKTINNEKLKKNLYLFNEIHYIDIDLDGSGAYYTFFDNKKPDIKYLNKFSDVYKISEYTHKVNLNVGEYEGEFYCYLMDPNIRIKKNIFGDTLSNRWDVSILDDIFIDNIINLINSYCKDTYPISEEKNPKLFIFDCSPGYNNFTQSISERLCTIENLKVTEIFASTFDNTHVSKTIENLDNIIHTTRNSQVSRKVVLVNNYNINDTNEIINDIKIPNIELVEFPYNEYIYQYNIYKRRRTINDKEFIDAYDILSVYENILK